MTLKENNAANLFTVVVLEMPTNLKNKKNVKDFASQITNPVSFLKPMHTPHARKQILTIKYFNEILEDQCSQPAERGSCAGNYERWAFDTNSRSCQPFIWGGCEGNTNRFISESACIQKCDTPGKTKG